MKKIIAYTFFLYFINVSGQDTLTSDSTIVKVINGKFLLFKNDNDSIPFTGISIMYYNKTTVKKSISNYIDGICRINQEFYKDGNKRELTYYDSSGIETGEYIYWDSTGNYLTKGEYLNGLKHGFWIYFENGYEKQYGQYLYDKKSGIWKLLDSRGNIIKTEYYVNGILKGNGNGQN